MGNISSTLSTTLNKLMKKKPPVILIIGLDGTGKTSILNKLKGIEKTKTVSTVGFNVERITCSCSNLIMTFWDVGGQKDVRCLWSYYYEKCDGIIFVVDSTDRDRIKEAKLELFTMLSYQNVNGKPLLILANKQDINDRMSLQEIIDSMDLNSVTTNEWTIQACSAQSGEGLCEGLNPLVLNIAKYRKLKQMSSTIFFRQI